MVDHVGFPAVVTLAGPSHPLLPAQVLAAVALGLPRVRGGRQPVRLVGPDN